MPIHFSIGFVVESRPKRPVETVCVVVNASKEVDVCFCPSQQVTARTTQIQKITCVWETEAKSCQ